MGRIFFWGKRIQPYEMAIIGWKRHLANLRNPPIQGVFLVEDVLAGLPARFFVFFLCSDISPEINQNRTPALLAWLTFRCRRHRCIVFSLLLGRFLHDLNERGWFLFRGQRAKKTDFSAP